MNTEIKEKKPLRSVFIDGQTVYEDGTCERDDGDVGLAIDWNIEWFNDLYNEINSDKEAK